MTEQTARYETVLVSEYVPEQIEEGKIYAVYRTPVADQCGGPSVTYRCPCGCGREVYLPCRYLGESRTRDPQWEVSVSGDGTVTLAPSILERSCCRSHYFIRNGRVLWT